MHEATADQIAAAAPTAPNSAAAKKEVERSAEAMAMTAGTIFSLVLAAAWLPLALILRQRAYRVVTPWARTETWLAVHGFALQANQQLGKVLIVLGPMLAGGPLNGLIRLLSEPF